MDYNDERYYQEENIDIKKFLFKILANWYWFAISLFVGESLFGAGIQCKFNHYCQRGSEKQGWCGTIPGRDGNRTDNEYPAG